MSDEAPHTTDGAEHLTPSPCTQGEGGEEGAFENRTALGQPEYPLLNPLPEYREREPDAAELLNQIIDDESIETTDANDESPSPADELDSFRIRQLSSLRRATYRSRSHAIIVMLLCFVGAAQLALTAWLRVRAIGWTSVPILCVAMVPVALWGVLHFFRRAVALHREAIRPLQDDPESAPDFSTLGDGSQLSRNLDEVR